MTPFNDEAAREFVRRYEENRTVNSVFGTKRMVHIEWMDGKFADVEAAADPVVHEGVLRVQRFVYSSEGHGRIVRTVNYPVANIRCWE